MTSLDNPNESSKSENNKESNQSSAAGTNSNQGSSSSKSAPGARANKTVSFSPNAKASSSSSQGPQKRLVQQRKRQVVNAANIKKENLAQLIQKKKECEKKAHEIVLRLIDPKVEKEFLLDNAIRISLHHMEDVIEERKLSELCGWVLCDNRVDLSSIPKQKYKIHGHKVYDITERKSFCDGKCYAKATHFKSQLLTSPLWLRDLENDIQFEILEDDDTKELRGLSVALTSVTLSDNESEEEGNEDQDDETNANAAERDRTLPQRSGENINKDLVLGDIIDS